MKSKNKLIIRLLSIGVSAALVLGAMPITALAEENSDNNWKPPAPDITIELEKDKSITLKDADCDQHYDISTADELYAFAAAVNGGKTDINGELTANIIVNENVLNANGEPNGSNFRSWTPIGDSIIKYTGHFNGNGYYISGLYCNNMNRNRVGLFGSIGEISKVTDGVVNLGIIDSYFNAQGNSYIGAIAGNCQFNIKNCYSSATVKGNRSIGGIAGNSSGNIENCYNIGSVSGTGDKIGEILGEGSASVKNCYYLADSETDTIAGTVFKTEAQFKSGEVAFLLDSGAENGVWGQTLGKENYPSLTGWKVYQDGESYTNIKLLQKDDDGNYKIETAYDLTSFAALVNAGERKANAALYADIDMEGIEWIPICSTGLYYSSKYNPSSKNYEEYPDRGYEGKFNGKEHMIKNLSVTSVSGKEATYGFIGTLSGMVTNLGIEGFKYTHNASDIRTGAIAGQILGGYVIGCYVRDADITPGVNVAGGIAGCNYGGTIDGCCVYNSKVSATASRTGYIVGDNRADAAGDRIGEIYNCCAEGNIEGSYSGKTENSYKLRAEQFKSGLVSFLMNKKNVYGHWRQRDGYPVLNGKIVNTCGGDPYYSENGVDKESHDIGEDLKCRNCGQYDMPSEEKYVFSISSLSELKWYCENRNEKWSAELVSDLSIGTADKPFENWCASMDNGGIFNGNGHTVAMYLSYPAEGGQAVGLFTGNYVTIKNLILKGSISCNTSGRVGAVDADGYGVKFSNIISYVDITNKGSGNTGGLVGEFGQNMNNGSTITSCAVYADISGNGNVGGLIGAGWNRNQYWTVTNSAFCGKVTGNAGCTGGLVGYSMTDAGAKYCKIEGCYYFANGLAAIGKADQDIGSNNSLALSQEGFASGEAAWLLNGSTSDGSLAWYQNIGTDSYPSFEGRAVLFNKNADTKYFNAPAGDINRDGVVDIRDLVRMKKSIAASDCWQDSDLDGNKATDALDLALLRKLLIGLISAFSVNQG